MQRLDYYVPRKMLGQCHGFDPTHSKFGNAALKPQMNFIVAITWLYRHWALRRLGVVTFGNSLDTELSLIIHVKIIKPKPIVTFRKMCLRDLNSDLLEKQYTTLDPISSDINLMTY